MGTSPEKQDCKHGDTFRYFNSVFHYPLWVLPSILTVISELHGQNYLAIYSGLKLPFTSWWDEATPSTDAWPPCQCPTPHWNGLTGILASLSSGTSTLELCLYFCMHLDHKSQLCVHVGCGREGQHGDPWRLGGKRASEKAQILFNTLLEGAERTENLIYFLPQSPQIVSHNRTGFTKPIWDSISEMCFV